MKGQKQISLITAMIAVLAIGCTEKRDDRWAAQGPKYHATVEAFDGKMFDVKTKAAIAESSNTTVNSKIEVNVTQQATPEAKQVTVADLNAVHSIVEFDTDAELAKQDQVIFRGRPNTSGVYQIMYRVMDNRLMVLKVADRKDMPWYEIPLAVEELEDGRLAYPLLEYPITHLRLEKAKNSDNEDTNMILEIPVQTKAEGTVFTFNRTKFERPKELELNETFPVSFFSMGQGNETQKQPEEWYFLETIVDANADWEYHSGLVYSSDNEGNSASRVFFKIDSTGSSIEVRNAQKPEQHQNRDENRGSIDNSLVMSIPAQFFDLRLRPTGTEVSASPEKNTDRKVEEREFVQVNLAKINSSIVKSANQTEISEIVIEDGYFSFVLETTGMMVAGWNYFLGAPYYKEFRGKVRYSFYKKSQRKSDLAKRGCTAEFEPRIAFADDFEKFGTFTTKKTFVANHEYRTRQQLEQLYLISRHNPKCDVVYHVGEKTKKKYLPHARRMIEAWSETLKANGVKLNVRFSDKPVRTGDVRYNTVDIIEPVSDGGWSGIAQTVTDPDTGEVIYAQAQIQAQTLKAAAKNTVLMYLREKLGQSITGYSLNTVHTSKFSDAEKTKLNFIGEVKKFDNFQMIAVDPEGRANIRQSNIIEDILSGKPLSERQDPVFTYLNRVEVERDLGKPLVQSQYNESNNIANGTHSFHKCDHASAPVGLRGNIVQMIERYCSVGSNDGETESLFDYISRVDGNAKGDEGIDFQIDNAVIDACVENIVVGANIGGRFEMSPYMIGVGLHEVGHTFALRHNFAASTDEYNFYSSTDKVPELAKQVKSASVMDYSSFKDLWASVPGKYDVAAIRFIYDGYVDLKDGGVKEIDVTKPLSSQSFAVRPYKFCSDMQAYSYASWDCAIFDYGATPLEIVENHIQDYRESLASRRLRYDDAFIFGSSAFQYRFLRMARIYEEWRYELSRRTGASFAYLDNVSTEAEYKQMLQSLIAKDPQFKQVFETYYPAVEKMHEFLLEEVAFMPNRYCVYGKMVGKDNAVNVKAIELSKIRRGAETGSEIISCESPSAIAFVNTLPEFNGLKLIEDVGYEVWDAFYDKNVFKQSGGDSYSVAPVSIPDVRGTASDRINALFTMTWRFGLHPLSRREGFVPSMMDEPNLRIKTQSKIMERVAKGVKLPTFAEGDGYFSAFSDEQSLIEAFFMYYRMGMGMLPGQAESSMTRLRAFDVFMTNSNPASVALASTSFGSMYMFAQYAYQTEAINLINQANMIEKLSGVYHQAQPNTQQDLEKIAASALKATEALPEDPMQITVGAFKEFAATMQKLKANGSIGTQMVIDMAFASELTLAGLLPDDPQAQQSPLGPMARGQEIVLERIKSFTFNNLMERLIKTDQAYSQALDNFRQAPDEMVAQRNMIKNVLARTSYFVGNVGQ